MTDRKMFYLASGGVNHVWPLEQILEGLTTVQLISVIYIIPKS